MEGRVQEIFSFIDKDSSNSIELSEFKAYAGSIKGLVLADQTPEQVFNMIDTNGDGDLTIEELKAYIQQHASQFQ